MALKDLVANSDSINEEDIEGIISNYVRYDPVIFSIIFTPEGASLKNESKLLVYLVAVLGWKYVVDEPPFVETKPASLEVATGISGGTLRPLLKQLKDRHLISVSGGHYKVQSANLSAVRGAIAGKGNTPLGKRKRRPKKSASGEVVDQGSKQRRGASGDLRIMLNAWLKDGFFNEPRTIKDLLHRYHEHGAIVKQTSLSGLLLRAVRDGSLARTKAECDGRQVWFYRAK